MTRTGRAGPDTSAVPWVRDVPLRLVVLGSSAVAVLVAGLVRLLGQPPWCSVAAAAAWVTASVVAQPGVQLRLGGGRLDNRVVLRMTLATALFTVLTTALGAGFLLPLFVVTAAVVHIQWSGPAAWQACAATLVVGTAAGQAVAVAGLVPALVAPARSVPLAAITVGVVLPALLYVSHVAAHREQHARMLERAVRLDPLTGVLARAAFLTDLERRLRRVRPGAGLGLLFCDLDDFKAVNDTYGHLAGDVVLTRTARRVLAAAPVGALVGRVGGDEFLVAVPDVVDPVLLAGVANSLGAAAARPVELPDGGTVDVALTVGAAWTDDPARSADDLVAAADAAMYAGKNSATR